MLTQIAVGKRAAVQDVTCGAEGRRRLADLGICADAKITVTGFAPLGDPMLVEVCDAKIAIRKSDARYIIVSVQE